MPIQGVTQRILVKAAPGVGGAQLSIGSGTILTFSADPLFKSIGRPAGPSLAAPSQWYVLTLQGDQAVDTSRVNVWDACHRLLTEGLGVAGAPAVEFAEPDLEQRWLCTNAPDQAFAAASSCDREQPQDARFPRGDQPLWFREDGYSQFTRALSKLGIVNPAQRVRVAHLDTGFDPEHGSLPNGLRRDLQKNYVDAGREDDATDDSSGLFNNFGHGTGTLGILAGKAVGPFVDPYGSAPFVDVVPVRVANSVVLFRNSAIARAFDYVHSLCARPETCVHVVTMSMGGVASQAWADAVNALYEAGVFIVTAAGNNYGNLPTRNIVYPARFHRVVAACGVMADHNPYTDLGLNKMAGNYGPQKKMRTALAACTPNMPWAKRGCSVIVDLDGQGTSSATPQVAAAAAIWIQKNKAAWEAYSSGWMRVEAVRNALFTSGRQGGDGSRLGRGELEAAAALDVAPALAGTLKQEETDDASFALLRVLTGLGVAAATGQRQRMLEVEALQLSQSAAVEAVLPDPDVDPATLSRKQLGDIAAALASDPRASAALKQALGDSVPSDRTISIPKPVTTSAMEELHLARALEPQTPVPPYRRLRVYAYDPSVGAKVETAGINETVLDVMWEEELKPGPVGEYLEIMDVDPAGRCVYAPVDLNDPSLLVQDGLRPSETDPRFHQQMVYAVAMKTIGFFERALGRVALWAPRINAEKTGREREQYVQRLRIYPHAIMDRNAFYSPDRKALLFGYFRAPMNVTDDVMPGGLVHAALSHDIVAHETTHALLDGLHVRFREATNPDVLAFHEGFADIVALLQHFTLPQALRHEIARARGDLSSNILLSKLAVQFGQATGRHGALRDFIGKNDEKGEWQPREPKTTDYESSTEPHDRGAVLVAAVFDAFVRIYSARRDEIVRLATSGTGLLPQGELSADLREWLTLEASKVARQVLNMCIRALDFAPPTDLTFGDYLRGLITADHDLVPNDVRGYRVAFVAAFRARGVYATDATYLSAGTLVWEPPPLPLANLRNALSGMSFTWDLKSDREKAFHASRDNAKKMHDWLLDPAECRDFELDALGFVRKSCPMTLGGMKGTLGGIEVHSVRPARRIGPDGELRSDVVVEITQSFHPEAFVTSGRDPYRGGCTLLIDLATGEAKYFLRKRIDRSGRIEAQRAFRMAREEAEANPYFDSERLRLEPFAMLHRGA